MTKDDQKEGLLKRVKNIGDKNEELLKAIKDQRIKQSESKKLRLKMIWFVILITIFTNTDCVNFLKYHQLNLNLIRYRSFTETLLV